MSKSRTPPPASGNSRGKDQTCSFRDPFTRPSMYLIGVRVNGYRDCWLSMYNSNFPGLVPTYNFCGDFLLGLKEFSKLQLQAGSKQIYVITNQSAWLSKFILWKIGFGHTQLKIHRLNYWKSPLLKPLFWLMNVYLVVVNGDKHDYQHRFYWLSVLSKLE